MYTIYFFIVERKRIEYQSFNDLIFIKENLVKKIAIYFDFKMVHCCVFLKKDRTIFNHYQILSFQKSI